MPCPRVRCGEVRLRALSFHPNQRPVSPSKVAVDQKRGYIVPVGGAEDKEGPAGILRKFVEISGGKKKARIAIVPTASSLADTGRRYEKLFGGLGVAEAYALPWSDRKETERADWLRKLEDATGIFLTGGNQLRISTTLGGTPVAKAIRKANARGVPVGGTSAGAAILSEHMIAMGGEGPTPHAGMATLAPGLGLTNRVIIDQHFRQRDRLGRLLTALAYNPFAIGIGLDEDTAAFIDGDDRIEVIGAGAITIVDAASLTHSSMADAKTGEPLSLTNIRLHLLTEGGTFDLSTREAHAGRSSS
jgi:cyanophycinase